MFDHENGNWKNSEVASAMLEILAANDEREVTGPDLEVAEVATDNLPLFIAAETAFFELHRKDASHLIISELNKIADTVGDNPKAALELELAIEDIKEILK